MCEKAEHPTKIVCEVNLGYGEWNANTSNVISSFVLLIFLGSRSFLLSIYVFFFFSVLSLSMPFSIRAYFHAFFQYIWFRQCCYFHWINRFFSLVRLDILLFFIGLGCRWLMPLNRTLLSSALRCRRQKFALLFRGHRIFTFCQWIFIFGLVSLFSLLTLP